MRVVATAGHVDHGKSSLVRLLTGTDPDRWEEERRRGMTIDLGFAWCTLPSGREVGFVDVPGHERFVRTMLAGVGPVRLVVFVVAADEGWRAQTEEHLAIVDVLGVDGAVVAITKRDLVDDAGLAATIADVRGRLAGTVLAEAPVVACSATTGAGMDDLRDALDAQRHPAEVLARVPSAARTRHPLPGLLRRGLPLRRDLGAAGGDAGEGREQQDGEELHREPVSTSGNVGGRRFRAAPARRPSSRTRRAARDCAPAPP